MESFVLAPAILLCKDGSDGSHSIGKDRRRDKLHNILGYCLALPAAIYRSAQGPGPESAPRSAFWVFLGTWLPVPQRVLLECFLAFLGLNNAKKHSRSTLWGTRSQVPNNTQKALRGHFPARAPEHSCKWRLGAQDNVGPRASYVNNPWDDQQGTKNQPKVFQTEVFSWTSARHVRAKMFVFAGFGGPDRSFWPDVRRDVRPKTSVFGLIFRFWIRVFNPSSTSLCMQWSLPVW